MPLSFTLDTDKAVRHHQAVFQVGDVVRKLRLGRQWTLDDLVERSGVSRGTLSLLERGESNTTKAVLEKVAKALQTTVGALYAASLRSDDLGSRPDVPGIEADRLDDDVTDYKRDDIAVIQEGEASPNGLTWDVGDRPDAEVERTSRPYDFREKGAYAVVLRGDSMEPLLKATIYLTYQGWERILLFMDAPTNLLDAIRYFTDPDNCRAFMMDLRWPDGKVACPRCGSEHVVYLSKPRVWKCYAKHPSPTFSLKTGTIFEDSPLGLDKWLAAVWLVVNCKNGISSYEMARDLGVTQKSAWFMNHRIRRALHVGSFDKLTGEVEVDETFIGGKARNMHVAQKARRITGTGGKDKVAVMGILQRDGKVRTVVVPNRKKHALQAEVTKHVEAGSALYSDALLSYEGLASKYAHQVIDHAVAYVDGNVHTNGLENYWSLLKRGLNGTYVSVEPFHLFRYLDEQAFRFNNRKDMNDFDRFKLAASQIVGKRLTYAELSGQKHSSADSN